MNDGFVVENDIPFAAAIAYVFGFENLISAEYVEDDSRRGRRVVMTFDAPSEDCKGYRDDWDAGNFAVSDLRAYSENYSRVTRVLKQMDRNGQGLWKSDDWHRHR